MEFMWNMIRGRGQSAFFHSDKADSDCPTRPSPESDSQGATSTDLEGSTLANALLSQSHRNKSSTIFPYMFRPDPLTPVHQKPRTKRSPAEKQELRAHYYKRLFEKRRLAKLCEDVTVLIQTREVMEFHGPRLEEILENDREDPVAAVAMAKESHRIFREENLKDLQRHIKAIVEEMEGPLFEKEAHATMEAQLDPKSIYIRALPLVDLLLDMHFDKYDGERDLIKKKYHDARFDSGVAMK